MKFVKDKESDREDYIFQDNQKTRFGTTFIIVVLALLVMGVFISGLYFELF